MNAATWPGRDKVDPENAIREASAFMILLCDHINRRDQGKPSEGDLFTDSTLCGLYLLRQHVEDRLFLAFYGRPDRELLRKEGSR